MSVEPDTDARVAILSFHSHGDRSFLDDRDLAIVSGDLRADGFDNDLWLVAFGAGQAEDARTRARLVEALAPYRVVVFERIWDRALVEALRAALPGRVFVHVRGEHVLDDPPADVVCPSDLRRALPPLVAFVLGRARTAPEGALARRDGAWVPLGPPSLSPPRPRTYAPNLRPKILNPEGFPATRTFSIQGNAGCPYQADARDNPLYAGVSMPEGVGRGCAFCTTGNAYEARPPASAAAAVLEQLRYVRRAAPERERLVLKDQNPFAYLVEVLRALGDEGLGGFTLMLETRADWLTRNSNRFDLALDAAAAAKVRLAPFLVGVENFSQPELDRFNKGIRAEENEAFLGRLDAWKARHGDTLDLESASFGFVLFTPWTTLDDLETNLRAIERTRFDRLRGRLLLSRVRLYPDTALYHLAARDGLFSKEFDEGEDSSTRYGYYPAQPWRHLHPEVAHAAALARRLVEETRGRDEVATFRALVEALRAAGDPCTVSVEDVRARLAARPDPRGRRAPARDEAATTAPRREAPAHRGRGADVVMLLPPDADAPEKHLAMRFPPLGPAVVAAATASLGLRFRAVDLALELHARPLSHPLGPASDRARVAGWLRGAPDEAIDAVLAALLGRIEAAVERTTDVAISIDRGSQIPLVAALTVALKRTWGARIIVGGVAIESLRALLLETGAHGADVVTTASTPASIARVFAAWRALPTARLGPPLEPDERIVTLGRASMRTAPSAEGWPLPDFSLYDLDRYRRDPVVADLGAHHGARLGPSLVLPYFFSFECQFSCAFCQTGGNQEAKPADLVVRELATLAERWGTRDFMFFNTQINLLAEPLARALVDAKLDLRWSDSFRVRPLGPDVLEWMAKAGCASLTVGIESASERVLKAMVKGHRPEHATEMVREAHAHDILLRANILTCYPGESADDLRQTCDWVEQNAFALEDVAASSFYLTADSPIGRKPERHGIVVRGARALDGPTRFRKSPDSLEYDEVDGLTWEEREPTLEASEVAVLDAWRRGRRAAGLSSANLAPSTMVALRRRFDTKAEIAAFLAPPRPAATSSAPVSTPPEALRATLIAPAAPGPGLARAFERAFGHARPALARTPRLDGLAHALLFPDGSYAFFRGGVQRDAAGRTRALSLDGLLSEVTGPAARDARAALLVEGARLDAAKVASALGAVAVVSFRVEAATEASRGHEEVAIR